jgi:hypothetical protein
MNQRHNGRFGGHLFINTAYHRWNRYRRPAVPVRSGPGPHFRPAGLPFDQSGPATGRFIFLIFFCFFHMKLFKMSTLFQQDLAKNT